MRIRSFTGELLEMKDIRTFHITGVTVMGRRFRIETDDILHCMGINLFQGSKWAVLGDGHRRLLTRV